MAIAVATCASAGVAFAQWNQAASPGSGAAYGEGGGSGGHSRANGGGTGTASGQPSSGGYAGQRDGRGGYGGHGNGSSGAASGSTATGGYPGRGTAPAGAPGSSPSAGYAGHGGGQAGFAGTRGSGYDAEHGGHGFHYGDHGGLHGGGFDQSNPRWWQGRHEFSGYGGHRTGFFFVPGYGYRPVPVAYAGRPWAVGAVLPPELRGYAVPNPTVYGVAPAPAGYRWIYVDDGVAMIDNGRGVIVRSVWHIW